MDFKFKKLSVDFAEKNYPTLAEAVDRIKGLDETQKQLMLGLGLEICLQSNGSTEIFLDELDLELDENEF